MKFSNNFWRHEYFVKLKIYEGLLKNGKFVKEIYEDLHIMESKQLEFKYKTEGSLTILKIYIISQFLVEE